MPAVGAVEDAGLVAGRPPVALPPPAVGLLLHRCAAVLLALSQLAFVVRQAWRDEGINRQLMLPLAICGANSLVALMVLFAGRFYWQNK